MSYENLWPESCKELSCLSCPRVVSKPGRRSALLRSSAELVDKTGRRTTVREVVAAHDVTVLFFGSPCIPRSREMTGLLVELQSKCREMARSLSVIYVPLFTYRESSLEVENDFLEHHGDWWTMRYQSWESLEARYMHRVCVVPTLVVLDREGAVVTECGHVDLYNSHLDVLITWF